MKGIRGCLCLRIGLAEGVAVQGRAIGLSGEGWLHVGSVVDGRRVAAFADMDGLAIQRPWR